MSYLPVARPFQVRPLAGQGCLAVSASGDIELLSDGELQLLQHQPEALPLARQAELAARFFLGRHGPTPGTDRLLRSRIQAKRELTRHGPSLHIIVPTLQCAHSCRYCQVSRALDDTGHSLSPTQIDAASDAIFESDSPTLTVEYQGGDPLIRFDLVQRSIARIAARNRSEGRQIRSVVASTLHQLDDAMCAFFQAHDVHLSTSVDGPPALHNANRTIPGRNAYERTVEGMALARRTLGHDKVSALMTTTRLSLSQPEAIVDTYVQLGLQDIFLRPLSAYGFAKRNQAHLGYALDDFKPFYQRALARVLHWNRQGVALREVHASIILNKLLCTFDSGYVDLQSPTAAGRAVVVHNYDGHIYPSDEARMLAETGERSLRLGPIGTPLTTLRQAPAQLALTHASEAGHARDCSACAYQLFCAPNPVDALAQHGTLTHPAAQTEHCQRHLWLFDHFAAEIFRARREDGWLLDLFHQWAQPREAAMAGDAGEATEAAAEVTT
ncbi:His-Xaa-Ser system radical SAM maturase HxsB [Ideonella dechloratans]|uniref:His-Xaa-Ser system radical SAM maturase HxsB n=1 Tax=Ideonella dechloratans TaxID=36863 RepID=UPI0035AEEE4E